jgi:ribosome-binding factor A
MKQRRTSRINSLLKEVISEVITKDVRNPNIAKLITLTKVEITSDMHQAKVYVSVIGTEEEKKNTISGLQAAAGFIGVNSAKKVVLRYFPSLTFKLDTSLDKHMEIEEIIKKIHIEKELRKNGQ